MRQKIEQGNDGEVGDDKFDALYLHDFYENVIAKLPYNFTNIANRHTAPYGYSDLTV